MITMRLAIVLLAVMNASGQYDEARPIRRTWSLQADLKKPDGKAWPQTAEEAAAVTRDEVVAVVTAAAPLAIERPEQVGEFQVVQLMRGKWHLVVVLDSGGKKGFSDLNVIHCSKTECVYDALSSEPEIDLKEQLPSIRNDGIHQVVIVKSYMQTAVTPVLGYLLYEMTPSGLVEASAKYREWYDAHFLEALKQQMDARALDSAFEDRGSLELKAEMLAKGQRAWAEYLQRVTGVRDAIANYALQWAKSAFQAVQQQALFEAERGVDQEVSQKILRLLETSPYADIRETASAVRRGAPISRQ
jgi:hypothetical protein